MPHIHVLSDLSLVPLLLIIFLNLYFPTLIPIASAENLTAYQVLEEYDLPVGLLPSGVVGYELNSTTGAFKVYLNETCTFSVDSYKLKYKKTISGVISTDELTSLSGISVKVWWFWLSIKDVIRDGEELDFNVGVATAEFAVSTFDESPTCGCGFDCDDSAELAMEMDMETEMKVDHRLNGRTLVSSS